MRVLPVVVLLGCTAAEPEPTTIRDRCFPGIGDPEKGFPDYDALGAIAGESCAGTAHQTIDGIERLVFLGDSITVGTPPTPESLFYRHQLELRLVDHFGPLEVDSCAEWGAETDDLQRAGVQLDACFGTEPEPLRTLVVMTVGGNDMMRRVGDLRDGKPMPDVLTDVDQSADQLDAAIRWLKDPTRFPAGVFVVFANVYEFTDTTGDLESCPTATALGFTGTWPELRGAYVHLNERYVQTAVQTGTDAIFLLEHFCGHGFHAGEPDNECFRGEDAPMWFDGTCIHPNPDGHYEIADLFYKTIVR